MSRKGVPTASSINLPENLTIKHFDFQGALSIDDIGDPGKFKLSRVTDEQRQKDQVAYQEMLNYMLNVRDGYKVVTGVINAAAEATKAEQAIIGKYQVGIEGIRESQVRLEIAQQGTEATKVQLNQAREKVLQEEEKLEGLKLATEHLGKINKIASERYNTELDQLRFFLEQKQQEVREMREQAALPRTIGIKAA
jgi:hypothetical protein